MWWWFPCGRLDDFDPTWLCTTFIPLCIFIVLPITISSSYLLTSLSLSFLLVSSGLILPWVGSPVICSFVCLMIFNQLQETELHLLFFCRPLDTLCVLAQRFSFSRLTSTFCYDWSGELLFWVRFNFTPEVWTLLKFCVPHIEGLHLFWWLKCLIIFCLAWAPGIMQPSAS